jgi:hypothetical protein
MGDRCVCRILEGNPIASVGSQVFPAGMWSGLYVTYVAVCVTCACVTVDAGAAPRRSRATVCRSEQ